MFQAQLIKNIVTVLTTLGNM